jgi:cysteine desulfurase / selenocysteine lyase
VNREEIRSQFPELNRKVHDHPLSYFDSGATTLKPEPVIKGLNQFYGEDYATIHRGAYLLSEKATKAYEDVRAKVAGLIRAPKSSQIIFTSGTTDAINLVANTYGQAFIKSGQVILVSALEHHSNIVPWQMLCERVGSVLKVIPMNDDGVLNQEAYEKLLKENEVALVAFNHVSNALGTINPVVEMTALAHEHGAKVLVDGAQSIAHCPVDVQNWDLDFFAFSSHKVYGPTGCGVLYGKEELLKSMPPWKGGGDMIYSVSFEKSVYADPPARFEAGTPPIAEVIGLGIAIDWLLSIGLEKIEALEQEVQSYALERLPEVKGLRLIGKASKRAGAISFLLDEAHPHDIATLVDSKGVAIRAGHHCAQPVMTRLGIPATARASLGVYNNNADVDRLVDALHHVNKIFGV